MWTTLQRRVVSGSLFGALILFVAIVAHEEMEFEAPVLQQFDVFPTLLNDQAIQLVISWMEKDPSVNDDRMVDLTVRTQKVTKSCPIISCLELGISAGKGSWSLPQGIHYLEEPRGCDFRPGCRYVVFLTYEESRKEIQREITIPDCVEHICRCEYEDKFPNYTISLDYAEEAEMLHFRWEIDKRQDYLDESELRNFVVRYYKVHNAKAYHNVGDTFEPHLVFLNESLTGDPWNGRADLPLTREWFGITSTVHVARIKVEIFLMDSKECSSYSSPIEYLELRKGAEVENSHWVPTSLIVSLVVISVLIGIAYIYKKSKMGQHVLAKLFRLPINYSNINIANNSMTRTSIALQENVIYVEKELYDAKMCGIADDYEISPSCLSIGQEIGKGAFGRVFIALAHNADGKGNTATVAVKRLKRNPTEEEAEEFFNEIKTMKRVGYHENIISLLGCCTLRQPALMIMEYIGNGDLHRYLIKFREQLGYVSEGEVGEKVTKSQTVESETESEVSTDSDASYVLQNEKPLRPSVTETLYTTVSSNPSVGGGGGGIASDHKGNPLDHRELQQFAIQIANGMSHLEDLDITHRDLATRNILIDDRKRLKISDFGLSRNGVYVTTKSKKVPLRWLSIEAIRRSLYSSKSDVWAFGVVLWEIGTLGRFPYQGMDNHALLSFLLGGGRLKKPENCSDKLYDVMLTCWAENPLQRPSFFDLVQILQEPEQKIYIDLDELADNDDVFYETTTTTATTTESTVTTDGSGGGGEVESVSEGANK